MPPSRPGLRILLAEEPAHREALTPMLQVQGHTVVAGSSALEALSALETDGPFDLVLLGLHADGRDVLRVARLVRAREKATGGHLPIVVIVAGGSEECERCHANGVDDCLSWPVRPGELAGMIDRLAGRPEAADSWRAAFSRQGVTEPELRELAQTFADTVPGRLACLRQALATGDALRVAAEAHALKGALLVFSARRAVEAASRLEALGREGPLDVAAEPLAVLEGEVSTLLRSLEAFLGGGPRADPLAGTAECGRKE
jgi:CheY-like chemotaxis protein